MQLQTCTDTQRHVETHRDTQRHVETCRDTQIHIETRRGTQKHLEARRDTQRHVQKRRDMYRHVQTRACMYRHVHKRADTYRHVQSQVLYVCCLTVQTYIRLTSGHPVGTSCPGKVGGSQYLQSSYYMSSLKHCKKQKISKFGVLKCYKLCKRALITSKSCLLVLKKILLQFTPNFL